MIEFMIRATFGLLFYEIGLFYAGLGVLSTLIRTILGGRRGVRKLFNRKKHEKRPESKIAF